MKTLNLILKRHSDNKKIDFFCCCINELKDVIPSSTNGSSSQNPNAYLKYQSSRLNQEHQIYSDYNNAVSSFYANNSTNFPSIVETQPNSLATTSGFISSSSSSLSASGQISSPNYHLNNVGIHFASHETSTLAYENPNLTRLKLFQHFSGASCDAAKPLVPADLTNYSCSSSSTMPNSGNLLDGLDNNASNVTSNQPVAYASKQLEDRSIGVVKKPKKSRVLFSQWQINELEKLFKKQKYVTSNERELMAKRLKLQANQVKIEIKIKISSKLPNQLKIF